MQQQVVVILVKDAVLILNL